MCLTVLWTGYVNISTCYICPDELGEMVTKKQEKHVLHKKLKSVVSTLY